MNKLKRTAALLMAAGLSLSMLAGCGTPGQDSTSASPGAEQNTTVGAAEGYTYKIATVRWNDTWPTDFLTDGVMGDLAKEADIDIEWQIYYSNDFGEQKALLFASDDLPDAFFGSCGLGDSDIVQNKEKLLELTDLINEETIFGSEWVGFKNFTTFFNSYQFWPILRNTLVISIYSIVVMFPLPILVALICSQITSSRYKKFFQVTTYLPHFISTVVMCGMIMLFLSPSSGIIAKLLSFVGIDMPNLMGSASAFPHIYVWTEAWQHIGWDSILYIAALSSIDPTLYEAATIDGANKWHKIFHIDIPSLLPTIMIMLILRMGSVMSVGFEKVYLLQNSLNNATSEIIATYVYKMGLLKSQYSLSAAIGLFNNVINLILLLVFNFISAKISEDSLF